MRRGSFSLFDACRRSLGLARLMSISSLGKQLGLGPALGCLLLLRRPVEDVPVVLVEELGVSFTDQRDGSFHLHGTTASSELI